MGLPKLNSCCCGCSLKTGTIIIGSLGLVSSVILALLAIVMLVSSNSVLSLLDQASPGWRQGLDYSDMVMVVNIVGGVLLAVAFLGMVIPACLIHGARTANKCLMMPWIVLTAIGLVLDIINIIGATISLSISNIVSSLLGWLLCAYFLLVVWNYKNQVEAEVDTTGVVHYQKGGQSKA